MRRLRIGLDLDETLNNLIEKLILAYNEKYFDTLKYENITTYDFFHLLKPTCINPFKEFCSFDFMMNLDVADGAVEALNELSRIHDMYFVTAGFPETMLARNQWLKLHFPFYRSDQLIACVDKQLLRLDVLVDDYEQNLIGGEYTGFLINKPWNEHINFDNHHYIRRLNSIKDLPKAISEVCI